MTGLSDYVPNLTSVHVHDLGCKLNTIHRVKKSDLRDFPGGPVVKTPSFQCRGCGFGPWSGN